MGIKETKKRNNKPIVIEVDEDELIDEEKIQGTRQSTRIKNNRIKSGTKRGHLRIEG